MRRALLAAGVAIPLVVLAVTAGPNQVLDLTNFNPTDQVSYINEAQCTGADKLHLQWNINSTSFAQNDVYKLFASNKAPTDSGSGKFCLETDDNAGGFAGPVGSTPATTALASLDVSGSTAATTEAHVACASSAELTPVYICAHWYDGGITTKKGSATGTFLIQVNAPPEVTGLSAPQPGTHSLEVSWAANPDSPTRTDHYVAMAFTKGTAPAEGTKPSEFTTSATATATTKGTSATIDGLENGQPYDVIVVAYSVGGNPSGASASVEGTPVPSAGFWDVYKSRGGTEEGGCTTGSTGALSILATVSLLAMRRRKP